MSDDTLITLEINDQPIQAKPGQMLIEVADAQGITVPRFCYHNKLSVAANCRMCLVEVERAPKPLPACATPIADGMKVWTRSAKALAAQKGVMEFLLINHPLDCPICDQGGECDLQEMAMGFGGDVSRFAEGKRVVRNKDLGPLVSTDMTRCIHCTRCVRFGEELAGVVELGATGRGEHTEIGTYVQHALESELSGNVIDLCPVGALTSSPFRYRARHWEMQNRDGIAMHDALGSNITLQTREGKIMRVLPRENDLLNECWLSDRDRFSYLALESADRLLAPEIRNAQGQWVRTDWETALQAAADGLRKADPAQTAAWLSPSSTLEELSLATRWMQAVGVQGIEHRLRAQDFSASPAGAMPGMSLTPAELEQVDAAFVIGSQFAHEQPLLNMRLRKAALRGAQVSALNARSYRFNLSLAQEWILSPAQWAEALAQVLKALQEAGASSANFPGLDALLQGVVVSETARAIATSLRAAERPVVVLGALADSASHAQTLQQLTLALVGMTQAQFIWLPVGANRAAAAHVAAMPSDGTNALAAQLEQGVSAALLLGIEPDHDIADARAMQALRAADQVVALTAYDSPALREVANVLLPIAAFAETSGTQINALAQAQSFTAAVAAPGEARPAWKVLRVLANLSGVDGFDESSSEEVRDRALATAPAAPSLGAWSAPTSLAASGDALAEQNIYAIDMTVRRSQALQRTPLARDDAQRMGGAA
jgi:NADH-quinone oxidoreductase subunit G